MTYEAALLAVREVVAETFDVRLERLGPSTVAEDVDGWDSLNHTILLVRLARRLDLAIDEGLASQARSVGDLAHGLVKISATRPAS